MIKVKQGHGMPRPYYGLAQALFIVICGSAPRILAGGRQCYFCGTVRTVPILSSYFGAGPILSLLAS
jgi:hypothetical protein